MGDSKRATHLEVGVITRPHGVRGELKVRLHFEGSQALGNAEHLVLESPKGDAQKFVVESVRGSSKGPILALVGVDGREAAELLRGHTIWVERALLPPLEEGEYYLVDLVGCSLCCEGTSLGRISAVRPDPSVDTMVVQLSDGTTGEVPIVDAWVGEVDLQARTVQLNSLDGLIRES